MGPKASQSKTLQHAAFGTQAGKSRICAATGGTLLHIQGLAYFLEDAQGMAGHDPGCLGGFKGRTTAVKAQIDAGVWNQFVLDGFFE